MKTHTVKISKKTLTTIITQARSLGAFHRPKGSLARVIRCEVERGGKRSFIELPERLCDWLKDFDDPPSVEITAQMISEHKQTPVKGQRRDFVTVKTVFNVHASAIDGKRTSRLSCTISRLKTPPQASVLLRIEEGGNVVCVERVAKLARVECAHGKRFIRAMVLSESHGGKWLLTKGGKGVWPVLFQPAGMIGVAVALAHGVYADTEADAIAESARIVTDEAKERVFRHQFEKACELAEQAEREAREAMGEEVGEIVRAKRPEVAPVPPAPSPVVESVAVAETVPMPPAMESAVTPSEEITDKEEQAWQDECAARVAIASAKLRKDAVAIRDAEARLKVALANPHLPELVPPPSVRIAEAFEPIASTPPPSPIGGVIAATVPAPSVDGEPCKPPCPSPYPPTAEYRLKREAERWFACFAWLAWSTAPSIAPIPIQLPPPRPPKRSGQRERVRSYVVTFATLHRPCPTMPSARANAPPSFLSPCRRHFRPHLPLWELRSVASLPDRNT